MLIIVMLIQYTTYIFWLLIGRKIFKLIEHTYYCGEIRK